MKKSTFFGQRDCPPRLDGAIYAAAERLIVEQGVGIFYVGESGRFETQVRRVLPRLKAAYPQIEWYVVPSTPLAATPSKPRKVDVPIFRPEELDRLPTRFAVALRNDWLVHACDYVICYNPTHLGFAAQYILKAKQQGKEIVYLEA